MATVHHIVLLRFKPDVNEAQIEGFLEQLAALREQIPGITSFAAGPNNSPEGLDRGFTHGFVMTFESADARDAYLPHPAHEQAKQAILPSVAEVLVLDFEDPAG